MRQILSWVLALGAGRAAALAPGQFVPYLARHTDLWHYLADLCQQQRAIVVLVDHLLGPGPGQDHRDQCRFRRHRHIETAGLVAALHAEPDHQFHPVLLVVNASRQFRGTLATLNEVYLACEMCLPPLVVADEPAAPLNRWLASQLPSTDSRFRCTVLAADRAVIHVRPVLDGCRLWQGTLMPSSESELRSLAAMPWSRCNLAGTEIRISVNDFNPFCDLLDKDTRLRFGPSIDFELVKLLASKTNFTYELVNAHQDWGVLHNGSWSGSVGQLVNGSADMAVCCISQTEARSRAVIFSHFTVMDEITFISSAPDLESRRWLIAKPFELWLWLCVLGTGLLLLITLAHIGSSGCAGSVGLNLFAMLVSRAAAISWRDESSAARLVYLSWMLAVMVLATAYSCSYYSMLTVAVFAEPLDRVADLERAARTDTRRIDALQSGSFESFFSASSLANNGIFQVIAEHIERTRHQPVTELEAAFDLMHQDPRFVLIDTRLGLEFMRKTYALKPMRIGFESLGTDSLASAFPKRSSLFGPFNHYIRLAQHTGLFQHWTQRLFLFSPARDPVAFAASMQANLGMYGVSEEGQSLRLDHLSSAFLLWAIGLLAGSVALALEISLTVSLSRRRRRQQVGPAYH